MKRLFTLMAVLSLLIPTTFLSAQNVQRICGHDLVLDQARAANPNFDADYDALFRTAVEDGLLQRQEDNSYIIQVVFHVLYDPLDSYTQISDELILSQLEALNRDFNKRNADTSDTREVFKHLAAGADIKFVLAKKKNNNCADAIIRKEWTAPAVFLPIYGDVVIKNDDFGGSSAWNTRRYLNIWVADLNPADDPSAGYLGGYAFLPGLANSIPLLTPVAHDGVVIDYRFFGQDNPYIPEVQPGFIRYNQGRTTVHEVGHWLGLRHIWGDLGTLIPEQGCNADDGVDDTPNAAIPYSLNGFCQDTIVNSCDDGPGDLPDMFENYMDYSTDECNTMFTLGQVTVMHGTLTGYRQLLQEWEYPTPTTQIITATVTENTTTELCFDLEECYQFGTLSSFFEGGDSTAATTNGQASLVTGQNCISYTAGAFGEDNTDEFYTVTYNNRFDEYDTTWYEITIEERCPKVQESSVTVTENESVVVCVGLDACVGGGDFTIATCSGGTTYSSDVVTAVLNDTCVTITGLAFEAGANIDQLCIISSVTGTTTTDTTYINVEVEEAVVSGVNNIDATDNFLDVYPNPTTGKFRIAMESLRESMTLGIYDALGQLVQTHTLSKGTRQLELDMTGNAPGVYMLYFEGAESSTFEKLLLK